MNNNLSNNGMLAGITAKRHATTRWMTRSDCIGLICSSRILENNLERVNAIRITDMDTFLRTDTTYSTMENLD